VTREEALLWLNDRLGQTVEIDLRVDFDGDSLSAMSALGVLGHWTSDGPLPAGETGAALRESLIGLYEIGASHFDLSEGGLPYIFSLGSHGELVIAVPGLIEMRVSEPRAPYA
jgi:hypothetical protein